VLEDSRDRSSVVRPTDEKSLSDCAELADMHSTRLATSDIRGKSAAFSREQTTNYEQ